MILCNTLSEISLCHFCLACVFRSFFPLEDNIQVLKFILICHYIHLSLRERASFFNKAPFFSFFNVLPYQMEYLGQALSTAVLHRVGWHVGRLLFTQFSLFWPKQLIRGLESLYLPWLGTGKGLHCKALWSQGQSPFPETEALLTGLQHFFQARVLVQKLSEWGL